MLSRILILVLVIGYSRSELYGLHPKLVSEDGNLVLVSAEHKNISLRTSGRGYININDQNVLQVMHMAIAASEIVQRIHSTSSLGLQDAVERLANAVEGPHGLEQRVGLLENRTDVGAAGGPKVNNRRLAFRVATVERQLRTLMTLLTQDECVSNPCTHGGTCLDMYNGYTCKCPSGWEGHNCDTDVNECALFVGTDLGCQNGATCLNKPGTYECSCASGFYGIHCTRRAADCNSGSPADLCGHGTCIPLNTEQGYKCICDQGWETNGVSPACTEDVDECVKSSPCSVDPPVQCINTRGDFHCGSCGPGYTGNGRQCYDINECLENNGGCSLNPLVSCINTRGGRTCGACPPGYQGNGVTCTQSVGGACSSSPGYCHPMATCIDNMVIGAGFMQCRCPMGYTGNGIGPTGCQQALGPNGEVISSNACANRPCINGICRNTLSGLGFTCLCRQGFSGPTCAVEEDRCNPNPCRNNGLCVRSSFGRSGYRCECPSGFTGINCSRQTAACGGVLSESSGTLAYPSSNSSRYLANTRCAWVIQAPNNTQVLNVTFTKFHLESSTDCQFDWLQIHDGRSSAAHLLGRYCGTDLPNGGSIISTHHNLYLWFRADHTIGGDGFRLHWQSIQPECGGVTFTTSHGVISSPGSPGNYPPNRDCYWNLLAPPNKRLQLHFFTLRLEAHPDCGFDYLAIYSGDKTTDPRLAMYCNTTRPEPLITPGPEVMLHFHSDPLNSDTGFQIAYSVIEGIPGCGGTFTTNSGEFGTPVVDGQYPPHIECDYKIVMPAHSKIELEFISFEVERSYDCHFDHVTIYDGDNIDAPVAARHCGFEIPPSYKSTGNTLLIKFASDWSVQKTGFRAKYRISCGGTFTGDTGIIESPGYPEKYFPNRDCKYLIQQPIGKAIKLNFTNFDIEGNSYPTCYYDAVIVHDGDTESSPTLGRYCGDEIPPLIMSTHNYVLLKFISDTSLSGGGWRLNYTTVNIECGGILTEPTGIIASHKVDDSYPSDARCTWVISAPAGYVVQLTWMSFALEQARNCIFDSVEIYDNNTAQESGQLIGKYCGNTMPPTVTSSGRLLTIIFKSDMSREADGFMASYSLADVSKACGGKYYITSGTIRSPGYPDGYPNNKDCAWTIVAPYGQQIKLNISNFFLENHSSCRFDYLEIRNGGYENSPLIGKYCGQTIPSSIPSFSNQLYLKFHSDMSRPGSGFEITWDSTSTGCGGTLTSSHGSISSPNYPQPYGENSECYWKIATSAGSKIQVVIIELDLEHFSDCNYDYLEFYDGKDASSKKIGKYCEPDHHPTQIQSTTNNMYLRLRSDHSNAGRGFLLNYVTVCNANLTSHRGAIESPNFPQNYPEDLDCTWTIKATMGNKIILSFSHFHVERVPSYMDDNANCIFDYVEIKEKSIEDVETVLGRYCGDNIPASINSSTETISVHFKTDHSTSKSGFRLEWITEGCGGEFTHPEGVISSPNYPREYPPNKECHWLITTAYGNSIELKIDDFDMEPINDCHFDSLTIYDAANAEGPELTKICNTMKKNDTLLPTTTTNTNQMFLVFKTDSSYHGHGFHATYKTLPSKCGGKLSGLSGSFHSPNYPQNYDKNTDCYYQIEVYATHIAEIIFIDFDIESEMTCDADYVKIYDGTEANEDKLLLKHCGNTLPAAPVKGKSNTLLVHFHTDYAATAKGFKANYATACGARILTTETQHTGVIQSREALDNKLPNCTWIIIAENPTQHVTLTISQMQITSSAENGNVNEGCESHYLELRNGDSETAPLINRICGSKIPAPITSEGNALTITLGSAWDVAMGTFSATYSILDSACGGNLEAEHGIFTSPKYPRSYPNNAECVWIIPTAPGNKIHLTFIEFALQQTEHCNLDYLEIRENDALGKIIGVFCGDDMPTNMTVSSKLWIKFRSGDIGTAAGFKLDYSYVHNLEIFNSSGQIASPLYPHYYMQDNNMYWRINVEFGKVVSISFREFSIDSFNSDYCYYSLNIYDGYDTEAPELLSHCGLNIPDPVKSTSNVVFIKLDAGSMRRGSLFLLDYQEQTKEIPVELITQPSVEGCGSNGTINLAGAKVLNLTSPGYPLGYTENLNCEWIFEAPVTQHVALYFADVDLEEGYGSDCTSDYVQIYSGRGGGTSDWNHMMVICRSNATSLPYFHASAFMKVVFKSDYYYNKTGFRAVVFPDCGGELTDPTGIISISNNLTHFRRRVECQWNITVRLGRTIAIDFLKLDIPAASGASHVCENYVMLKNGFHSDSPFVGNGKYCGNRRPDQLTTSGNHLYVKFDGLKTSSSNLEDFFKIQYREVSYGCGGNIYLTHDNPFTIINSPNYPNIPPPHTECEWTIMAPNGENLQADFIERFDLTGSRNCKTAFVEIRDGGTANAQLLGKWCYKKPGTQKTSNNILYVKYFTDVPDPKNGFQLNVTFAKCGGTIRAEQGHIQSMGFPVPGAYPRGTECFYHIIAYEGTYITLDFKSIDLPHSNNCTSTDHILVEEQVRDDNGISTVNIATVCGSRPPLPIQTSGHEVLVVFKTEASSYADFRGFNLQFNSTDIECGGELNAESGIITSPGYPNGHTSNIYCKWYITVPEGRRIKLEMLDTDLVGTRTTMRESFVIYNGHRFDSRIMHVYGDEEIPAVVESTSHKMMINYWTRVSATNRGFKMRYSSNELSLCSGSLDGTTGIIRPPSDLPIYYCEWTRRELGNNNTSVTLALVFNPTQIANKTSTTCKFAGSYVKIFEKGEEPIAELCSGFNGTKTVRTNSLVTTVSASQTVSWGPTNFTLEYRRNPCGGHRSIGSRITQTSLPVNSAHPVDCAWTITNPEGSPISLRITELDFKQDCSKAFLLIYNGAHQTSPIISSLCRIPDTGAIISQGPDMRIEYHSATSGSDMKLDIEIEARNSGCGGILHPGSDILTTPNFYKHEQYGNNVECEWEIRADEGYHIGLVFEENFHIEQSEGCVNDFLEIFDYQDENWILLAKKCGREIPPFYNSTGSRMKVRFVSNDRVTDLGFRARWYPNCGGIITPDETFRYLTSPGYKAQAYAKNMICNYTLVTHDKFVNVKFIDFELEDAGMRNCMFDNLTIYKEQEYAYYGPSSNFDSIFTKVGTYCGRTLPPKIRTKNKVSLLFLTDKWVQRRGFKIEYNVDFCGGAVNTQKTIQSIPGNEGNTYGAYMTCVWNITAPENKQIVLRFNVFELEHNSQCIFDSLSVYNGFQANQTMRLAHICGNMTNNLPLLKSTSNKMSVVLKTDGSNHFRGFSANVIFTYGESAGCGGTIRLNTTAKVFELPSNLKDSSGYLPNLDCHWVVTSLPGTNIQFTFNELHLAPCPNHTRNATECTCDFVEIRDGMGPFSELIGRYCGHNLPTSVLTSSSSAWIRFTSDGVGTSNGFKITMENVPSMCGPVILNATTSLQVLKSPNYPNKYSPNTRCIWRIIGPPEKRLHIHIKNLDLQGVDPDGQCSHDALILAEKSHTNMIEEGLGEDLVFGGGQTYNSPSSFYMGSRNPTHKHYLCGNNRPTADYYLGYDARVTFVTDGDTEQTGFELEYSAAGCSRNYSSIQGRLLSDHLEVCTIVITAPENHTISLFFQSFLMMDSSDCTTLGLEIREGTNLALVSKLCGYSTPSPVFTDTNIVQLRFFGDNIGYGMYDIIYTATDKGKGCGGTLFNYGGIFTSPMYPASYREEKDCRWDVAVPHGSVVVLKFDMFDLGSAELCETNYLELIEVHRETGSEIMKTRYCGGDTPANFYSATNELAVRYVTTVNNGGTGWTATFIATLPGAEVSTW